MTIGIDISQIAYKGTGVGRYVEETVKHLLTHDRVNSYLLFASSLRQQKVFQDFFDSLPELSRKNVSLKILPLPPTLLEFMWNTLHIVPIEWIVGHVDIFWSSDWTQPPLLYAKGVTTIHDLTIYRFPENFPKNIVAVHKRKIEYSRKICRFFFCDSEATKRDAHELLGIPKERMTVVHPGYKL